MSCKYWGYQIPRHMLQTNSKKRADTLIITTSYSNRVHSQRESDILRIVRPAPVYDCLDKLMKIYKTAKE